MNLQFSWNLYASDLLPGPGRLEQSIGQVVPMMSGGAGFQERIFNLFHGNIVKHESKSLNSLVKTSLRVQWARRRFGNDDAARNSPRKRQMWCYLWMVHLQTPPKTALAKGLQHLCRFVDPLSPRIRLHKRNPYFRESCFSSTGCLRFLKSSESMPSLWRQGLTSEDGILGGFAGVDLLSRWEVEINCASFARLGIWPSASPSSQSGSLEKVKTFLGQKPSKICTFLVIGMLLVSMVATPLHPDLIFSLENSCDTVGKKYWFLAGFVAGFSLWMFWFILGQAFSKGALVKSFIASPAIFLGSLAAYQPSILKNWRRLEYNCNHCWGHWTQ